MLGNEMKKLLVLALWLSTFVAVPTASAANDLVVINELQCTGVDWIEIYNPTNSTVDLSGWILTDRNPADGYPTAKHLFVFSTGNVIKAKSHRIIRQGSLSINLKFGIDCTRQETIYLGYGSGVLWTEVDKVNPPAFEAGLTYGRLTSGGNTWGPTVPTEKTSNISMVPALNGSGVFTCKANKKCALTLTATRNGTFSLVGTKSGVTLSSSGKLTISARKKQTLSLDIELTNSYGSTTKKITVKFV
jgi:hypothetical protein